MFNGRQSKEVFAQGAQWIPYITELYLPVADTETGDMRQLPFTGSATEQPYMSMQVIKLIQLNYRIHINKKNKELLEKSKKGSTLRRR